MRKRLLCHVADAAAIIFVRFTDNELDNGLDNQRTQRKTQYAKRIYTL